MRAVVQDRYGSPDRLRVAEIDRPRVGADEALVRVRAASVHPDVWHVVTGRPFVLRLMGAGLRRPACPVPGTDLAGVVEQVGRDVTTVKPGDEVFGECLRAFAWKNGGAYAEYAAVPADNLALKPANVTFEQAASVPTTGYIVLFNLPDSKLGAGRRVLVNGAGGGVGTVASQVAKANGCHVTAVDHTGKLDLLRALGADEVVDYTRDDFTGGGPYDLIFDIPGNRSVAECRRALASDGAYVLVGHDNFGRTGRRVLGSLPRFAVLGARSLFVPNLRRAAPATLTKKAAMERLRAHLQAGELTPVMDRAFPLAEAGAAIRHLADGEPVGRIVLTV